MFEELKEVIRAVNKEQESLRVARQAEAPAYIAHGTHVPPEKFAKAVADIARRAEGHFAEPEKVFPKFVKETQNELDAIRAYGSGHPEVMECFKDAGQRAAVQQEIGIKERIFGIPTKSDESGKPVFDEQGRPEPQDGTFAYALKKCSACIGFTENGTPLLVGFEDKYKDFEQGKNAGHIYVLQGETFKPEYTKEGHISEYTSLEYAPIVYHREVSPKDAMRHGAQFVMFNEADGFDNWSQKYGKWPSVLGKDVLASLADEIKKGNAAYINETERGENPLLAELKIAQIEARIGQKRIRKDKPDEKQAEKGKTRDAGKNVAIPDFLQRNAKEH